MAFQAAAGRSASVLVGTKSYAFKTWAVSMEEKLVDVSNFVSGTYRIYTGSLIGATLDLAGPYDVGPAGSGGNEPLAVDSTYTFTLGVNANITLIVTAIVNKIALDQNIEDVAQLKITATISGSFTSSVS